MTEEATIRKLATGGRVNFCMLVLRSERAAQIVEFAVALPLLVVFVVGIFDFSSAFTLKQRLTNIARDAARAAAADPVNDLLQPSTALPQSVMDAFQTVDNGLLASKLNDCGVTASGSPSGLTWTFTASGNGCLASGLTITINRGYYFPPTGAGLPGVSCAAQTPNGQTTLVGTCVSIQYFYPWRFGRAASLLGASMVLPAQIAGVAVALNEN
jgi:Flp pilus assembly protein TadG